MEPNHDDIILYQSDDGQAAVDVCLAEDTVWLSQAQMTELFQRNKRTISEHIRNVFKEGELNEEAVVRNSGQLRTTGKSTRQISTTSMSLSLLVTELNRKTAPVSVSGPPVF